jgi:hypothetical protein
MNREILHRWVLTGRNPLETELGVEDTTRGFAGNRNQDKQGNAGGQRQGKVSHDVHSHKGFTEKDILQQWTGLDSMRANYAIASLHAFGKFKVFNGGGTFYKG